MLTGDLNARTGCALDHYVDTDPFTHIPGDDNLPPLHTLRRRKNCDSHINEHDQSLLEIAFLEISSGSYIVSHTVNGLSLDTWIKFTLSIRLF